MSSTITITRKEETNVNTEIEVPSFFQEYDSSFIAIVDKDTAICCTTGGYKSVAMSDVSTVLQSRSKLTPISKETFYKAYNKCIQSVTRKVAETVTA